PVPEAVDQPSPATPLGEPAELQLLGGEAANDQMTGQRVPAGGRVPDPESFGHRPVEAANGEEIPAVPGVPRGRELRGVAVGGGAVRFEQALPPAGHGAAGRPAAFVRQRDPGPPGQPLDRLGEGQTVDLPDESDDVPALLTAEAVEDPAGGA